MIAREQAMMAQRSVTRVLEAANAAHQLAQQLDEVKRSNSKLHRRCLELFAQLTKVKARIADLEIRLSADAFAPYAHRRARVVSQCLGACSWLRRAVATIAVFSRAVRVVCDWVDRGWCVSHASWTLKVLGGGHSQNARATGHSCLGRRPRRARRACWRRAAPRPRRHRPRAPARPSPCSTPPSC